MNLLRQKILLVDDNLLNLQLLGKLLTEHGFYALIASSVDQALAIAERKKPNLILTDIMMPDIDGRQLCRMLKDNHETVQIPVVFISATTDSDIISETYKAGGVDFLSKPFTKEELLRVVKKHLPYRQELSAASTTNSEASKEVDTITLKDTSLLDSLTAGNHALRENVIRDFYIICRRVEAGLDEIVRNGIPADEVLMDLHRLANLSPYLTNKLVIEEIRNFEKLLRASRQVSDKDSIQFVSLLSNVKQDLETT